MMSIEKLKKEVRKIRARSKRARYPRAVIESAVHHLQSGARITVLSQQIGISHQTLRDWLSNAEEASEVVIHRWPKKSELRFNYPDGCWIEGLKIEDLERLRVSRAVPKKGA